MNHPQSEFQIVDAHVHLGYCANFFMPDICLERIIAIMDQLKVRCICASHLAGLLAHHFEYAHQETLRAIQAFPGRIYGYAIYDPRFPRQSLRSAMQYLEKPGFVGIKIHPAMHACSLDSPHYDRLWRYASESRIPVLTHTWDATPQTTYPYELVPGQINAEPHLAARVADRFPEVTLILAHSGGHYRGHLQAIEAVQNYPRVYLDICGATITLGLLEWLVGEVGATRILYASDLTWIDPRVHLGRVLGAHLPASDKAAILWENANQLLFKDEKAES
jgi:hypothetical protein